MVGRNGRAPVSTTRAAMSRSLRLLCWLAATSNWKAVAGGQAVVAIRIPMAVPIIRLLSSPARICSPRASAWLTACLPEPGEFVVGVHPGQQLVGRRTVW